MQSKLLVLAAIGGRAFAQSSAAASTSSSDETSTFVAASAAASNSTSGAATTLTSDETSTFVAGSGAATTSFPSGMTIITGWLPLYTASLVGVHDCQTTLVASEIEATYTYTQGPSNFEYVVNTFSDGFSFIDSESCTFTSSATFSMLALCKETIYGSENGVADTQTVSSTMYPDQLAQVPITITAGAEKLPSGTGRCTAQAASATTSGPMSGSMSGSMLGSMSGSMSGSIPVSTHNAAPVHNVHKVAGIGAAALAGLALL